MAVRVETTMNAPLSKVWEAWTSPGHITNWYFASPDWQAPRATNDLRVGGSFLTRMEARDGSAGFDFGGIYTVVEPERHIGYRLGDGREVSITFIPSGSRTKVEESFDPETVNPIELQRAGWQAILDNFKAYVEASGRKGKAP
jgi:uncharacterized protein YndB with AHSA1/START domain